MFEKTLNFHRFLGHIHFTYCFLRAVLFSLVFLERKGPRKGRSLQTAQHRTPHISAAGRMDVAPSDQQAPMAAVGSSGRSVLRLQLVGGGKVAVFSSPEVVPCLLFVLFGVPFVFHYPGQTFFGAGVLIPAKFCQLPTNVCGWIVGARWLTG